MKAFRKTEKTYSVCVFCRRGFNIVDTRNLAGKRCPYCYFGKVEKKSRFQKNLARAEGRGDKK